jgi:hypothetical protein
VPAAIGSGSVSWRVVSRKEGMQRLMVGKSRFAASRLHHALANNIHRIQFQCSNGSMEYIDVCTK